VIEVKHKAVILIFVVGFITACGYQPATFSNFLDEDIAEHEAAIIESGFAAGFFSGASIEQIFEVDISTKKPIKEIYKHYYGPPDYVNTEFFMLKPGTYSVTYSCNGGEQGFKASLTDTVTLVAGHRYVVKHEYCYMFCGKLMDLYLTLWIEDKETKEVVSGSRKPPIWFIDSNTGELDYMSDYRDAGWVSINQGLIEMSSDNR
jgi:hypothetical protein